MRAGETLALGIVLGAIVARGENAAPPPTPLARDPVAATAPGARLVSPRVAALLTAATPKFVPTNSPATPDSVPLNPGTAAQAGDGIVRLPSYIVRDRKVPSPQEVNEAEVARRAMEHYLGPENGFDRGFLNLITSKQIPLLALLGSVSNEARAMARYREDERLRMRADLMDLARLTNQAGDTAGAAKIKREVESAFRPK
jgi:hypothetical protein